MRSNVGKWWQKDSSAINVLPTISVINHQHMTKAFKRGGGAGAVDDEGVRSIQLIVKLSNPINGKVHATLVPEPKGSQVPSYRKHLRVAVGEKCAIYQADLSEDYEQRTSVVLQSFEDEYLDDEDSEELDEQALAAGGGASHLPSKVS